jgi:hypothetical protein
LWCQHCQLFTDASHSCLGKAEGAEEVVYLIDSQFITEDLVQGIGATSDVGVLLAQGDLTDCAQNFIVDDAVLSQMVDEKPGKIITEAVVVETDKISASQYE